jgi:uncharacterized protein (TIGR00297 family)
LLTDNLTRAAIGLAAAIVVAVGSRRVRALSTSGSVAATVLGAVSCAAGWSWGILLVAYFVVSSALSRIGNRNGRKLVNSIVEKSDERDVWQVLANGGVFMLAALAHLASPSPAWYAVAAGGLAASAADTWATEIGVRFGGEPISILSGRTVPAGTSGGVTTPGTAGALAGALFIAVLAALARWPLAFAAIALGGVGGALADSILGASVQCRRWCTECHAATERKVHDCGKATRVAGGIHWLDNDAVNAICSVVGALITLVLR